ncbi:MAG: hypothetical protein EOM69_09050, partial [Clostridia bacterium]|nr:hypothetical protein [Clostridia bacterium]
MSAAASFECINIDITEFSGKKRHTPAKVGPGKVQPLWVIARVPAETPPGTYRGECTVNIKGHADTVIPLEITVDGEVLEDGGVSDAYRLARLAWLNSTIGLDDTVPAPFRPIEFDGRNLKVAMGEAALGDSGLPEKISVNGHRILAGAPEFKLFGKGFNTVFQHNGVKITKEGNDRTEWQASGQNNDIKYRLDGAVESDGMFEYALSLTPERNIT